MLIRLGRKKSGARYRGAQLEHSSTQQPTPMPFVANPGEAATALIGELLAELARPLPHGFVADDDAAGGQQLLNRAQPEREAEVQPDGMADDFGREAIPRVAGASRCRHPTRLLTPACRYKRGKARQVDVPPMACSRRTIRTSGHPQ